jgi:hypothetical protein
MKWFCVINTKLTEGFMYYKMVSHILYETSDSFVDHEVVPRDQYETTSGLENYQMVL